MQNAPTASDITTFINSPSDLMLTTEKERHDTLREFLAPNIQPGHTANKHAVRRVLKKHVGEPVMHGGRTLILRSGEDLHAKVKTYWVEAK